MHRSRALRLFSSAAITAAFATLVPAAPAFATTQAAPRPRCCPAMAYDAGRDEVVMFGGFDSIARADQDDTWVWDGSAWTRRDPAHSPVRRLEPMSAYDAARGRVVLFGGYHKGLLHDTWTWDGTDWTRQSPKHSPPARNDGGMAYDAARKVVVLFGGSDLQNDFGDTWTWDGTDWTKRAPAHAPTAREVHGMAYDAARKEVVLFGGYHDGTFFGDTWTWDGTDWTEHATAHAPQPRYGPGMATDSASGGVLLFGGFTDGHLSHNLHDTWIWGGSDWTMLAPTHTPPSRVFPGMATNAGTAGVVMFAGAGDFVPRGDTWTWGGSDWIPQLLGSIKLDPRSGGPGRRVLVQGWGFGERERVRLTFVDSVLGGIPLVKTRTDNSGGFSISIDIPANATHGRQIVKATGTVGGEVAKQNFEVP